MPTEKKGSESAERSRNQKHSASSLLDDCDRPACDDMTAMLKAASNRLRSNTTAYTTTTNKTDDSKITRPALQCPPKSPELGRSSWTLLHAMAAWYPERPSPTDQRLMQQFFTALARFYPCLWCASDFQHSIQQQPIQTETRKDLCVWLCEQHNLVNDKLGKPLFSCDIKSLDRRWRKSEDKDCNINTTMDGNGDDAAL